MTLQSDQGDEVVQSDQGSQDETGQGLEEETNDQPGVEVLGKKYNSLEELAEDYKGLHTKFQQKSQGSSQETPNLDELKTQLKEELKGEFVPKEPEELVQVLHSMPELKARKDELKQLASLPANENLSYSDIAAKYSFAAQEKLARAKNDRPLVGNPKLDEDKPRRITELDPRSKEYEEWAKANIPQTSFRRSR